MMLPSIFLAVMACLASAGPALAQEPFGSLPLTLEAEDTVLNRVSVQSGNAGFNGSGYADYLDPSGSFMEWDFNSTTDAVILDLRYALGGSASRTLDVELNGIVVDQLTFEGSGGWNQWTDVSLQIDVNASDNILRLVANGESGPNVDTISMREIVRPIEGAPTVPFTVEAEDTVLNRVSVQSGNAGFNGSGYADYLDASGSFMEWDFNATADAVVAVNLRYALGASASRTVDIVLNEAVVGQLTFESSGGWSQWTDVSFEIDARTGGNTLRLLANGESGPNVDTISVGEVGTAPPPPELPTVPFTVEAEDTVLSGVSVQSGNEGFNGSGYADYLDASGSFMEWEFISTSDAAVEFDVRYALGGSASRTLAVEVNGEITSQVTFAGTGGWATWSNTSFIINANSGPNTVRLIAIGSSGPNVDTISASSDIITGSEPFSYRLSTSEQLLLPTPILFLNHAFGTSQDWIERTIELTNVTDEPVTIHSLTLQGPFSLQQPELASGVEIDAGASLQVVVEFGAEELIVDRNNYIFDGTLQITSSDTAAPFYPVHLSGVVLGQPDARAEMPPAGMYEALNIVADLSGFQPRASVIGGVGENSPVVPGEATVTVDGEVRRALFFEAAVPSEPVRIQQLASMHNSGGSILRVFSYDYDASAGPVSDKAAFSQGPLLGDYRHDPDWFRTFLPPRTNDLLITEIDASGEIFSFVANGNTPLGPKNNGNIALQAFEIYDQDTLQRVEDTYVLMYDFSGGFGGDWNDNIYVVENIRPIGTALRFSAVSDGDGSLLNGDSDINLDASFTLTININQEDDVSFDASTVNGDNVRLTNLASGQDVLGSVNSTAFLNAITFTPSQLLDPNTDYLLTVERVVANNGIPYEGVEIAFSTGGTVSGTPLDGIEFEETAVIDPEGIGTLVTGLAFNADQSQLYATTLAGRLLRWDVDPAANLSNPQSLQVAPDFHALIGLTFDKEDPNRLWYVDNTPIGSSEFGLAENFSSKLSYIDISDDSEFTGSITDYATGFPRGTRDHMFNSIEFGPDGFLYGTVGSTSTTGASEFPLSASVVRIDTDRQPPADGFNVNTDEGYNPLAADAPVTVFAEGLRNSYDLVWHSNGFLYSANNGSIGGGGTPDDPSTPANEAIPSGVATQSDYLYRVEPGGYYGHPNATQGNFILAGGNPTAGVDPAEETLYPVGTQPDPNYRGFVYDFGLNRSPNGSIEYTADSFDGVLAGTLMVAEWAGGDRIVGLTLNQSGQIVSNFVVADGFSNPIDLTVHEATGTIIVAEMAGATGEVTVLSPVE